MCRPNIKRVPFENTMIAFVDFIRFDTKKRKSVDPIALRRNTT